MLFSGMLTAVSIIAIAAKFSPKWLRRCLGYDWIVDLFLSIGIVALFAGSGTISGLMTATVAGLMISGILFLLRKFWKYELYEKNEDTGKREWVLHEGKWDLPFIVSKVKSFKKVVAQKAEVLRHEWNNVPEGVILQ